ncbi:UDP-3-O-acyl-N-acetylglucosamine deacetylase [Candidatus Pelagibacter sp. HIMB109]|uniref:UDP-3-O-acyl-N-acetylglucosamine deacetylase n=1 Tax=Candidatus Pelagibacter sp. HIMB109 TaxID=3415412 RepID=UPI003F83046E
MFKKQITIKKAIIFKGIGLHSGEPVSLKLSPEKKNTGIIFYKKNKKIKASWKNAEVSQLCTKIKNKNITISTIEHLMSTLSSLGITNLKIEISGSEIPILDGSAKIFLDEILKVGTLEQDANQKFIKIKKKVLYEDKEKFICINPIKEKKLIIDFTIDYNDQFIKKQKLIYTHSPDNFRDIYLARTFCLQKDLEKIFSLGLGKGGSLDNAIIVSENKILNQGGLRYPNEFVKHKILDCIGDLYLAENQIWGKVETYGGGHELNLLLLREVFKNKENYEFFDY